MIYISQVRIHLQEKIIKFKASQLWNKLPTQLAGCQLRWAFVLLVYLPFSKLYIIVC